MPNFTYKALAADGTEVQGTTEASTKAQAVQLLSQENYAVYEITEGATGASEPWYRKQLFQSGLLRDQDIVALSASMSAMLEQHLPIDEALKITGETSQRPPINQALERVRALLVTGVAIEDAFAALHTTFPGEFQSMIRAGARSNTLASSFSSVSEYYARRGALKQKLLAAAAYPVFLIIAAVIVFLIILFTMVPALYGTLVSAGNDTEGMISVLYELSLFLKQFWSVILVLMLALAAAGVLFRRSLQRLLFLVVPPIRTNHAARTYARFARMLQSLLQSGERLDRALAETIDMTQGSETVDALDNALAAIIRGEPAGPGLLNDKSVPLTFGRLFDLGERANSLPSLLKLAADSLEASHERFLNRMTGLLTPILTLLVGGVIALLVQVLISAVLEVSQVAI